MLISWTHDALKCNFVDENLDGQYPERQGAVVQLGPTLSMVVWIMLFIYVISIFLSGQAVIPVHDKRTQCWMTLFLPTATKSIPNSSDVMRRPPSDFPTNQISRLGLLRVYIVSTELIRRRRVPVASLVCLCFPRGTPTCHLFSHSFPDASSSASSLQPYSTATRSRICFNYYCSP